mgnify:CR=1 FL=1
MAPTAQDPSTSLGLDTRSPCTLHALIAPPFDGIAIWGVYQSMPLGHRFVGGTFFPTYPLAIPHYLLSEAVEAIFGRSTIPYARSRWVITAPVPAQGRTAPEECLSSQTSSLKRFTVPVLTLSYETCLENSHLIRPTKIFQLGDSFQYLLHLLTSAMTLLRDGKFKPSLTITESGYQIDWMAALCPGDLQWLRNYAEAMPPIMRCATAHDHPILPPPPIHRLSAALSDMIRTGIRQAFTSHAPMIRPGKRMRAEQKDALAFLAALTGNDLGIDDHTLDRSFCQTMDDWLSYRHTDQVPFHPCIIITEPEGEALEPWTVTLALRSTADPGFFLPASLIWSLAEENGGILPPGSVLRDILLIGLSKAVSASPILKLSLSGPAPTTANLSLAEAATLLSTEIAAVQEMGIEVCLPAWWTDEKIRPSIEIGAKKSQDSPGGLLGVHELISFDYRIAIGDESISPEEFWEAVRQNSPIIRVRGRWVRGSAQGLSDALSRFERRYMRGRPHAGDLIRLSVTGQVDQRGDTDLAVVVRGTDAWANDILAMLRSGEESEYPIPSSLHGTLRRYQEVGHAFLLRCTERGFGACLADDMGLGKTIQTIAWLLSLKDRDPDMAPALIICPMSVVGNWVREIQRFAPTLSVFVHHGASRCKGSSFPSFVTRYDCVLTTYHLASRDIAELCQVRWSAVILDEAQNIKNPATQNAKAVRMLSADRRVALTGTPVENRLLELWSIMDFLNPGYLGSQHAFQSRYGHISGSEKDAPWCHEIRLLIRPFLLRRVKTDRSVIADLPEKMESKVFCTLTREQATLYQAVVSDMTQSLAGVTGLARRGVIFRTITRLKQICNHPSLFLRDFRTEPKRSGKVSRLLEMLEEVGEEGESALIFTQYASFAEYLAAVLRQQYAFPILLLTGKTPRMERERLISEFQSSNTPSFFVISLKAGGTGLNLTAATHVFHVDRWWNPAVEDQATDRTFRIGQKRHVQVHLLIAAGTLEEQIDRMNEEKRMLGQEVLAPSADLLTSLSYDELITLVSLRDAAVAEEDE